MKMAIRSYNRNDNDNDSDDEKESEVQLNKTLALYSYLGGFFTTMYKDQHLFLSCLLHHLLIANLIHQRHALEGGLLRHTHKLLF